MSSPAEFPLRFSSSFVTSEGSYKLLELPSELSTALENGEDTQFTIRGRAADDAVLCTAAQTYTLRAVTLSNTFLIVTGGDEGSDTTDLVVHDEISQILELVPSIPKLNRLPGMLRGCEYEEGHEEDTEGTDDEDGPPQKRARITKDDVREEIQASDAELALALQEYHVLEIDGHLRPLPAVYLTRILEALLTALVAEGHPLPPRAAPASPLAHHLDTEHDVPRRVVLQVLSWFGAVTDGQWTMDVPSVVREVGIGHLIARKESPEPIPTFLDSWRAAVGDTFSASVDIVLLEGNYLLTPPPPAVPTHITYFPASELPTTTTQLFTDLFITRMRWRAQDIVPFLNTVAMDGKERDKLLMKYARATTDSNGGVWYTARATHV